MTRKGTLRFNQGKSSSAAGRRGGAAQSATQMAQSGQAGRGGGRLVGSQSARAKGATKPSKGSVGQDPSRRKPAGVSPRGKSGSASSGKEFNGIPKLLQQLIILNTAVAVARSGPAPEFGSDGGSYYQSGSSADGSEVQSSGFSGGAFNQTFADFINSQSGGLNYNAANQSVGFTYQGHNYEFGGFSPDVSGSYNYNPAYRDPLFHTFYTGNSSMPVMNVKIRDVTTGQIIGYDQVLSALQSIEENIYNSDISVPAGQSFNASSPGTGRIFLGGGSTFSSSDAANHDYIASGTSEDEVHINSDGNGRLVIKNDAGESLTFDAGVNLHTIELDPTAEDPRNVQITANPRYAIARDQDGQQQVCEVVQSSGSGSNKDLIEINKATEIGHRMPSVKISTANKDDLVRFGLTNPNADRGYSIAGVSYNYIASDPQSPSTFTGISILNERGAISISTQPASISDGSNIGHEVTRPLYSGLSPITSFYNQYSSMVPGPGAGSYLIGIFQSDSLGMYFGAVSINNDEQLQVTSLSSLNAFSFLQTNSNQLVRYTDAGGNFYYETTNGDAVKINVDGSVQAVEKGDFSSLKQGLTANNVVKNSIQYNNGDTLVYNGNSVAVTSPENSITHRPDLTGYDNRDHLYVNLADSIGISYPFNAQLEDRHSVVINYENEDARLSNISFYTGGVSSRISWKLYDRNAHSPFTMVGDNAADKFDATPGVSVDNPSQFDVAGYPDNDYYVVGKCDETGSVVVYNAGLALGLEKAASTEVVLSTSPRTTQSTTVTADPVTSTRTTVTTTRTPTTTTDSTTTEATDPVTSTTTSKTDTTVTDTATSSTLSSTSSTTTKTPTTTTVLSTTETTDPATLTTTSKTDTTVTDTETSSTLSSTSSTTTATPTSTTTTTKTTETTPTTTTVSSTTETTDLATSTTTSKTDTTVTDTKTSSTLSSTSSTTTATPTSITTTTKTTETTPTTTTVSSTTETTDPTTSTVTSRTQISSTAVATGEVTSLTSTSATNGSVTTTTITDSSGGTHTFDSTTAPQITSEGDGIVTLTTNDTTTIISTSAGVTTTTTISTYSDQTSGTNAVIETTTTSTPTVDGGNNSSTTVTVNGVTTSTTTTQSTPTETSNFVNVTETTDHIPVDPTPPASPESPQVTSSTTTTSEVASHSTVIPTTTALDFGVVTNSAATTQSSTISTTLSTSTTRSEMESTQATTVPSGGNDSNQTGIDANTTQAPPPVSENRPSNGTEPEDRDRSSNAGKVVGYTILAIVLAAAIAHAAKKYKDRKNRVGPSDGDTEMVDLDNEGGEIENVEAGAAHVGALPHLNAVDPDQAEPLPSIRGQSITKPESHLKIESDKAGAAPLSQPVELVRVGDRRGVPALSPPKELPGSVAVHLDRIGFYSTQHQQTIMNHFGAKVIWDEATKVDPKRDREKRFNLMKQANKLAGVGEDMDPVHQEGELPQQHPAKIEPPISNQVDSKSTHEKKSSYGSKFSPIAAAGFKAAENARSTDTTPAAELLFPRQESGTRNNEDAKKAARFGPKLGPRRTNEPGLGAKNNAHARVVKDGEKLHAKPNGHQPPTRFRSGQGSRQFLSPVFVGKGKEGANETSL